MNEVKSLPDILTNLQSYVDSIRDKYDVPALSVAVWYQGQLYQAATGILNVATGVEATPDSIFQIGSISKVFTASIIMQLVDEGRVELAAPVKRYLRDFRVADPMVTEKVTVGQLLDHTSGIAGDFWGNESYTEDNAIARYLDRCNLLPQVHPLGENHCYSNAAYSIAGRLIEVVLGISWYDAVETRIFQPLGMLQSVAHPSQTLRYRAAMGHIPDPNNIGKWALSPSCYFPMGWAPGGSVLTLSASDLIKFARAHLDEGRTESGDAWLSSRSVQQMQSERIQLPPLSYYFATGWGLGWSLIKTSQTTMVGHTGLTAGQTACLQLVPTQNLVFAIQQNTTKHGLIGEVMQTLLLALAGIALKDAAPTKEKINPNVLTPLTGRYTSIALDIVIEREGDKLVAMTLPKSIIATPEKFCLKSINQNGFASFSDAGVRGSDFVFLDPNEEGIPHYLCTKYRLFIKEQRGNRS